MGQDARELVSEKAYRYLRTARGVVMSAVKIPPYVLAVLHERRVESLLLQEDDSSIVHVSCNVNA
jgi:hypothetical protein